MRDIKFRGKSAATANWIHGFLVPIPNGISGWAIVGEHFMLRGIHDDNDNILATEEYATVLHDTIGQYAELLDAEGCCIYEGDIIVLRELGQEEQAGIIKFGIYNNPWSNEKTHIGFYVDWIGDRGKGLRRDLAFWTCERNVYVAGNIWDNPELLDQFRTDD